MVRIDDPFGALIEYEDVSLFAAHPFYVAIFLLGIGEGFGDPGSSLTVAI